MKSTVNDLDTKTSRAKREDMRRTCANFEENSKR